jgi:streptogramin lyase
MTGAGADGGSSPTVRLISARVAFVGSPWEARVRVTGIQARPTFVYGGRTMRMRHVGSAWTARVSFSQPGRFTVAVRLGRRTFPLGAVAVGYRVTQPIRVEAEPGGTLLVADLTAHAILRLHPRSGVADKVADLRGAISVVRGGDGLTLAIGDDKLYRLEAGRLQLVADLTAQDPIDVAPGDDGSAYVTTYSERIFQVTRDGAVSLYARGFANPHGIAIAPGGVLYVADTLSGTLKRITRGGSVMTVTSGLRSPSDVLAEADGSVLVVEHDANRVTRVSRSGGKSTVIGGLDSPISLARGSDGRLYVAQLEKPVAIGRIEGRRLVRVTR